MPKKTKIDPLELSTFQEAMKGAQPLKQKEKIPIKPKVNKIIARPYREKEEKIFQENASLDMVHGDEFISFHHPGISHKMLRKLRKGQYNVQAMLDLHGMKVDQAEVAVEHFLYQCLHEGLRVVLIIHGKGHQTMPVLKNKLNHWLRSFTPVLAFCSAAPSHGSRGAMYVLLKRGSKGADS